jgi:hypothetical protein
MISHLYSFSRFNFLAAAVVVPIVISELGDWRDTWPALVGETIIRTIYTDFVGEYVTHCHFLKHEDMVSIVLYNKCGPICSEYSSTAMPGLRLLDVCIF